MSSIRRADDELVSIIIICFNQAHFLQDAIRSALAQTAPRFEIIVVDDGSTDNTSEVVRRFPLVSYMYQQNRGISAARNFGLRMSAGDSAVFLDADDRLLPCAVAAGISCLRRYPDSGFVFGRYHKIDAEGAVISAPNQHRDASDFYLQLLHGNLIGMQSTVMYPRAILDRTGGFDEKLRCCEDYELYLRIAREFPVRKHEQVVAEYRRHRGNMSRNYRFMLDTTLQVLNAEMPYASRKAGRKDALKAGISNWRNHYGSLMTEDFRNIFRMHGLDREAVRRLGSLASSYPQGIASVTRKALRDIIHRSLRMNS
jgi:glycosyltransferase involved in cell wall biosynthesis